MLAQKRGLKKQARQRSAKMNWKITLPCSRAEAEAMHEDDEWLELFANLPTLVADELEAFNDAKWSIQAYFDAKPDTHDIALLETRLNAKAVVEQLPDEDWLTLSQNSIAPVRAGRFMFIRRRIKA